MGKARLWAKRSGEKMDDHYGRLGTPAPTWSSANPLFVGDVCRYLLRKFRWLDGSDDDWVVSKVVRLFYERKLNNDHRKTSKTSKGAQAAAASVNDADSAAESVFFFFFLPKFHCELNIIEYF